MERKERVLLTILNKGNCSSMRAEDDEYCFQCLYILDKNMSHYDTCKNTADSLVAAKEIWENEFSDQDLEEALFEHML